MASFSISCDYCPVSNPPIIEFTSSGDQTDEDFARAWKATTTAGPGGGPAYAALHCPVCGATYQVVDDGTPVEQGGIVTKQNVSRPRIDSISVTTGPREGGNALVITGSALDVGGLKVRFAGIEAQTVDSRTATPARVVVQYATYTLNIAEQAHKVDISSVSGSFVLDESVTTTAGSTGVIRLIEGSALWIYFSSLSESIQDMSGSTLTGGISGASATVVSASAIPFLQGETISGMTTGATGTVVSTSPFTVKGPSAGFGPEELVRGSNSGAILRLTASPAYSGAVDVEVENEFGQRTVGARLVSAYTYD